MAEFRQGKDPGAGIDEQTGPVIRREGSLRLLRKLLVYHGTLVAILVLAALFVPDWLDYLPIGGVERLAQSSDVTASLLSSVPDPAAVSEPAGFPVSSLIDPLRTAQQLIITLVCVWLLMLPVSWVHKGIHRYSVHDHSMEETTLILPGVVAAIVVVVQHSLALAFSLAGIVAGVQFRRALQDTFDALFILLAIGAGISAGVAALEIATVLTVFFCYSTMYVYYLGDGLESDFIARKKALKRMRENESHVGTTGFDPD